MSWPEISLLVEGDLDEAVARRLTAEVGLSASITYGRKGINYVRRKVEAFCHLGRTRPLFVLVDLKGSRLACAPQVVKAWLPDPSRYCVFRVAVPDVEAWLLADGPGIASFILVPRARVPSQPETLISAKQSLIAAAHHSRSTQMRTKLVPAPGSTATQGPGYTQALVEFVYKDWSISRAAGTSKSLTRTLKALEDLRGVLATP
jgi:hypothetical protein